MFPHSGKGIQAEGFHWKTACQESFPGFTVAGFHGIIRGVNGATSFGSPVVSVHHIGLLDFIAVLKGESWFP